MERFAALEEAMEFPPFSPFDCRFPGFVQVSAASPLVRTSVEFRALATTFSPPAHEQKFQPVDEKVVVSSWVWMESEEEVENGYVVVVGVEEEGDTSGLPRKSALSEAVWKVRVDRL